MGNTGVVIRDGKERRMRVHNNVLLKFSVSLSPEDIVDVFPVTCLVEGMREAVLGLLKRAFTRARSWLEAALRGACSARS